jgi:hypothetical protein
VVNIGRAGMAGENVTQRVLMVKENEKAHRCAAERALYGSQLTLSRPLPAAALCDLC